MRSFAILLLIAAIAFAEESNIEKYSTACPGIVSTNSTYGIWAREFVKQYPLKCANVKISSECTNTEAEKTCITYLQEVIWDRCHWRFAYDFNEKYATLQQTFFDEQLEAVRPFMGNSEKYTFVENCAPINGMWWGILTVSAVVGSWVLLFISASIMKCVQLCKKNDEKEE
ncbi:hypothetical protein WA158_007866 [Blastocystis sp. Blastoise]